MEKGHSLFVFLLTRSLRFKPESLVIGKHTKEFRYFFIHFLSTAYRPPHADGGTVEVVGLPSLLSAGDAVSIAACCGCIAVGLGGTDA